MDLRGGSGDWRVIKCLRRAAVERGPFRCCGRARFRTIEDCNSFSFLGGRLAKNLDGHLEQAAAVLAGALFSGMFLRYLERFSTAWAIHVRLFPSTSNSISRVFLLRCMTNNSLERVLFMAGKEI